MQTRGKIVMAIFPYKTALIVGAGPGISASLARRLSALDVGVGLAARDVEKLKGLAHETGTPTFAVDATDPSAVARLFVDTEHLLGEPDVVIYNPGSRVAGRLADLDLRRWRGVSL
jgi:NADP-dependent 3-hydroxy acid dehydrogenase YdfG